MTSWYGYNDSGRPGAFRGATVLVRPGGGTGRRRGLKPPGSQGIVRVQIPPRAPLSWAYTPLNLSRADLMQLVGAR